MLFLVFLVGFLQVSKLPAAQFSLVLFQVGNKHDQIIITASVRGRYEAVMIWSVIEKKG